MDALDEKPPVIETPPNGEPPELTRRNLKQRIRQQEILAELGVLALQGESFDRLLGDTARLAAEALGADFCKVMEYLPDKKVFILRAGFGWEPGVVGNATVGADLESPAGFALRTGKPVISNHLENEERFRTPELLRRHGARRAMNVILQGDRRPFGVLEVDSRSENDFVEQDIAFLQGAANILGMAIERERHLRSLKAALARQQLLLREMNHRVKNSLAIVTGMLRLQAGEGDNPELNRRLEEASVRIAAIARAHDRLFQSSDIQNMDIGVYIEQVCRDSDEIVSGSDVEIDVEKGMIMSADRAISLALIVVELISHAPRDGHHDKAGGKTRVRVIRSSSNEVTITVRDEGTGLPADFNLTKAKGLSMRIVSSFVKQLGAKVSVMPQAPGAEVRLAVPLQKA
ncbi:MAG: histidine kinase dimerization/phosphoacceptor domain -containing protein [Xanthobacteraceae bacterium]